MNHLGLWVVRHVKGILVVAVLIVLSEITVCTCGFAAVGEYHPLLKALETTGGFLMTLTSPDSLKITSKFLLIGRCIGWVVSFMGWLTLPLLFALTLSRSQAIDQEERELRFKILQAAEKHNLTPK